MKILHITDAHFEFMSADNRREFYSKINQMDSDVLAITGDIGNSRTVKNYLTEMFKNVNAKLIYYVLGNHDYYGSSMALVTEKLVRSYYSGEFCDSSGIQIRPAWVKEFGMEGNNLIFGINNVADGKCGDLKKSNIYLNDYSYIEEYNVQNYKEVIRNLGKISADQLDLRLGDYDLNSFENVIILMHVSPFREASLSPDGYPSSSFWAPHFVNFGCGEVLNKYASSSPDTNFIVLCGHTHTQSMYRHLDNLVVYAGKGEYEKAFISGVLEINEQGVTYTNYDE
jgi:predicted phosphodiesterase